MEILWDYASYNRRRYVFVFADHGFDGLSVSQKRVYAWQSAHDRCCHHVGIESTARALLSNVAWIWIVQQCVGVDFPTYSNGIQFNYHANILQAIPGGVGGSCGNGGLRLFQTAVQDCTSIIQGRVGYIGLVLRSS